MEATVVGSLILIGRPAMVASASHSNERKTVDAIQQLHTPFFLSQPISCSYVFNYSQLSPTGSHRSRFPVSVDAVAQNEDEQRDLSARKSSVYGVT